MVRGYCEDVNLKNLAKVEQNTQDSYPTHKSNKRIDKSFVTSVAVMGNDMDMKDISDKINEYLEECSDGTYKCNVCGKISTKSIHKGTQKQNMEKHIETHLDGLCFTCPICQKTCRSRNSLAIHKTRFHK